MVEQPAGRGDQDVDAAVQLAVLLIEGDAADQKRHRQLVVLAVALEAFGDLGGQLARRLQDQRARHARFGAAAGQDLDHRQGEGGGLAGAGLGDADDVAAHQHLGDALGLDRRRRGVAAVGHSLEDFGRQAQSLEAVFGFGGGGGLGRGAIVPT